MNGRLLASRLIVGAVLVGFYGWLIANVIQRASGHTPVHVTPTQVLAGVLVVYLGALLWAVGFVGSVYVAYPRSAPSARFTVGRGPRIVRLNLRTGQLDWRAWSAWASYNAAADGQPLSLEQERRLLRATLWPGFAAAAILAGLAFVLPGRAWILATAVVCAVQSLSVLTGFRAAGPVSQLRVMRAYPAASALRKQARAALGQGDYQLVLTLTAQALAEPHNATMTWQMHLFAGNACMQLGKFADAIRHLEIAVGANPDDKQRAAIRSDIADAKLTEALRARTPLSGTELEQVRTWIAAPASAAGPASPALQHREAMLRLAENDPVAAATLCEAALESLEPHTRVEWQLVAATLVIAHARSGRMSQARELTAQLSPDGPLYAAATAELT